MNYEIVTEAPENVTIEEVKDSFIKILHRGRPTTFAAKILQLNYLGKPATLVIRRMDYGEKNELTDWTANVSTLMLNAKAFQQASAANPGNPQAAAQAEEAVSLLQNSGDAISIQNMQEHAIHLSTVDSPWPNTIDGIRSLPQEFGQQLYEHIDALNAVKKKIVGGTTSTLEPVTTPN